LEAVGSPAAGRAAFDLIRPGGIIATAGCHCEDTMSFTPVEAYDKNLAYKVGRCPSRYLMEMIINIIEKGELKTPGGNLDLIGSIFTHKVPLSEGVEAYKLFDQKKDGCIKVLLEVSK